MMVTLLCSCIAFTSCIGSFKLSNKVLSWNKQVSNSKFVNEVVFFCFWVIPVYEVTTIADVLVVNSIEFWSGDYDKGTKTWSAMAKNKPVEFMTFLDDNTVRVYLPGGKTMNVELSESGVATFREVIERDYAMLR